MVVLLAGASHTGKTVCAQQLLEKYKYPYLFSLDHLKMGLIRSRHMALTPREHGVNCLLIDDKYAIDIDV